MRKTTALQKLSICAQRVISRPLYLTEKNNEKSSLHANNLICSQCNQVWRKSSKKRRWNYYHKILLLERQTDTN